MSEIELYVRSNVWRFETCLVCMLSFAGIVVIGLSLRQILEMLGGALQTSVSWFPAADRCFSFCSGSKSYGAANEQEGESALSKYVKMARTYW